MRNYIQPGDTLSLIAPADVKSGDVITIGAFTGVAAYNAKEGDVVETSIVGVFELPKGEGALTQGQVVSWDAGAKKVTANGGTPLGAVTEPAGDSAATVRVKLFGLVSPPPSAPPEPAAPES